MRIKILHVIETLGPGGVEQRRFLLAKGLNASDFEQKIVCTKTKGPLADEIRSQGIEVIEIGKLKSVFHVNQFRKLLAVINSYRPHIIHGAVFEGVTMASISGLLGRVPVVIVEETSDPQNRSWRGNLLLRLLIKAADYVVGVSPSVIDYLKDLGISHSKIRLINNGVDVPDFNDPVGVLEIKRKLNIVDSDFVVGSVGRLRNFHKRFSDLIVAVSLLKDRIPELKLLIVGDGTDKEFLEKLAIEQGVEDRIVFAGFQYDTDPYYSCMDVFALASHMEAFGLVLAEAMFFKLPVIASNVGGMRYVVVPEVTGFLVPRHDPQAFADAIFKLYVNKDLRERMGNEGYQRALHEYSGTAYVKKVEGLYRDAVESKLDLHKTVLKAI